MNFAKVSEGNRQPVPLDWDPKPNEDRISNTEGDKEGKFIVGLMDGNPPYPRGPVYPAENGAVAAEIAANTICESLRESPFGFHTLRKAFHGANRKIKEKNEERGMYEKVASSWISTVGLALALDFNMKIGYFGVIGDPLAFVISPDKKIRILTEDQMFPWRDHLRKMHGVSSTGKHPELRRYQDKEVRNRVDAQCCGVQFRGFGELTGLGDAMSFLEMQEILLQPGMRIVLASDAIEALGPEDEARARCASEYAEPLLSLSTDPEVAVQELLSWTRAAEVAKGLRSDDATFFVADI